MGNATCTSGAEAQLVHEKVPEDEDTHPKQTAVVDAYAAQGKTPKKSDDPRVKEYERLLSVDIEPADFIEPGGHLGRLVQVGAIKFVKGSWISKQAEAKRPIPKRQSAPSEAFWDVDEFLSLWNQYQAQDVGQWFLAAVSYGWCDISHPDPDCFHLPRLAKVLNGLWNGAMCPKGAAVFWDYLSVFQSERDALQTLLFKAAIRGMQLVYHHETAVILKMMKMPPCPYSLDAKGQFSVEIKGKRRQFAWEYHDRGWPWFETNIANLREALSRTCLEFPDGNIPPVDTPAVVNCQAKGAPMHPDAFAKSLSGKFFKHGGDGDILVDLYRQTYSVAIRETKVKMHGGVHWNMATVEQYCAVIEDFADLREFAIRASDISGDAGFESFMSALSGKRSLEEVEFDNCDITDEGIKKICKLDCVWPSLRCLRLRSVFPDDDDALAMLMTFGLTPDENPLTDKSAKLLADIIPTKFPALAEDGTLEIFGHDISEEGEEMLKEALPRCTIYM